MGRVSLSSTATYSFKNRPESVKLTGFDGERLLERVGDCSGENTVLLHAPSDQKVLFTYSHGCNIYVVLVSCTKSKANLKPNKSIQISKDYNVVKSLPV